MDARKLPERVAVLSALRIEVEPILQSLQEVSAIKEAGFLKYVMGRGGTRTLMVGMTGMGKVRAAAGTQSAVDLFLPGLIVFCGTAGALLDQVRPLDLIVGERFLEHDTGPKDPQWLEGDPGVADLLESSARDVLKDQNQAVHRGGILSGDKPVLDRKERMRLVKRYGALAVDMEVAAAARVSHKNRVPMAVVKAITDKADRNGNEDFKKHAPKAVLLAQEVVKNFLELKPDP